MRGGRGSKDFKKGGKLGQGVGALKGGGLERPYKLWMMILMMVVLLIMKVG